MINPHPPSSSRRLIDPAPVRWVLALLTAAFFLITGTPTRAAFTEQDIQKLHVAYFGRPADPIGLLFWRDTATNNGSLSAVSNGFEATPEFINDYSGLTSEGKINKVFLNMFSHSPDSGALTFWSRLLSSGSQSLSQIVLSLVDTSTAANSDGVAFLSKVTAAGAFTTALNTPAEVSGYSDTTAFNLAKAWLFSISTEATLAAAIEPVALDATVAAITTPPNIAVAQGTALGDGVGGVNFGVATVGSGSITRTFTITSIGQSPLTNLAVAKSGPNAADFSVSGPGVSSLSPGTSTTFTVSFAPGAPGTRSAGLQIASNVSGTKSPFDIALTGTGQSAFQAWSSATGVSSDPSVRGGNGIGNLLNFAFGVNPVTGGGDSLHYTGNFAAGGILAATGQPTTRFESSDRRALFCRRKDFATAGLTYTVRFSTNLIEWVDCTVTPTVLADDNTHQIVSVPYPPGPTQNMEFFRIFVTQP